MGEFWVWCGRCDPENRANLTGLLEKARALAGETHRVCAVVATKEEPAEDYLGLAHRVLWLPAGGSPVYRGTLLGYLARQRQPEVILLPATAEDSQIASHGAAMLETGLSADCTDLRMEKDLLVMHRPAFGGGVEADILCPNAKPQMATVRPGVFAGGKMIPAQPEMEEIPLPEELCDPLVLLEETVKAAGSDLSEAQIVIAGGLGVGSRDGFALLEHLAEVMGGQVGATRAAVDAGFAPWTRQIGQTGRRVHPKLYVAFGISGSIQHIMGMHTADFVVAVNSDPKAPIFDYADVAIAADWEQTARLFLDHLREKT